MLRGELGRAAKTFVAHTQQLPGFRYVDIHDAAESAVSELGESKRVVSQQHEPLEALLHPSAYGDRTAARASSKNFQTAPGAEKSLPTDVFWILRARKLVVRVRYIEYSEQCELSVAGEGAAELSQKIVEKAAKDSIFRNKTLTLSYEAGKRDEYGDVEKPEKLGVGFSTLPVLEDADVILSERHRRLIERNVIDLDRRREVLRVNEVPARRGILIYGPPGTGKTYACRYIDNHMPDTTRIFLTGTALANVTAVFSLARLLQPAIIFLEDADLMFSSRDINLYSSSLGELMDQLDGLRPNEEVSLVMTTNAIDRLEPALKDRPGRISQTIYMGEPGPDLRERFLVSMLKKRDAGDVDIDELVRISEGATQAFLKEWVLRAVQVACERETSVSVATLRDADFREAMDEMKSDTEDASSRIVGFKSNG